MTDEQLQGVSYEDFMPQKSTLKERLLHRITELNMKSTLQYDFMMESIGKVSSAQHLDNQSGYAETSGRLLEAIQLVDMLQEEGVI